jgi:ATP-dependent DNA helicase RecG
MDKYPEREGRQLEFKRELSQFDGLLRTVVAFLNDIGGLVVVGVEDGTRDIRGLSEGEVESYLERLPQALADAIEPHAPCAIRTRTVGEATVMEVEVYPGTEKPYFIRSEGVLRGVYVRIGGHTKRASDEQVQELVRAGRGVAFDTEPVPSVTLQSLDPGLINELYRNTVPDHSTLRAEKLLAIDPVTKQDFVTVAGVVLLHPNPQRVFPAAEVLFTQFKGTSTKEILRTIDLSGPLSTVVYQILSLIEPVVTVRTERAGPRLQASEWSIPPLAIREALLNALVHRRYTAVAPVKVALFEDRLEIFSPGNFPGPIDLDELGSGVSYYRNPTIANFTRRLGLVERRGLGFSNMLRSCRENRNPPPTIIEGSDFVKVTFYSHRESVTTNLPEQLAALEPLRRQGIPLTAANVSGALGVSAGTARSRIKHLIAMGLVVEEGKGRATRYRWR